MKRTIVRAVAFAAGSVAITASTAYAIPLHYSDTMACGGDNFKTCAGLAVAWNGTTAIIHIRNVGTQGEVFTAFGFTNLPAGITITGSTVDPRLASRFVQGNAGDIQAVGFVALPPSPQSGLRASDNTAGPFVFTLTFSTLSTTDIEALGFSIHAQSGPNECSSKLIIAPNGVQNGLDGSLPQTGCATVVPEPLTLTLLGSGLAGIGGIGALRRRRKPGRR